VFSIVSDESAAYVNFLQISTVPSFDPYYGNQKSSTKPMRITRTIIELRERFQLLSREVIVPFHVDLGENIKSRFLNWRQKSKFVCVRVSFTASEQ
jgi:excinuclease ABC subunit C